MTEKELENMPIFRKSSRCAMLYELLCEELGLNPLEPTTSWKDVAKAYSLVMEDARKKMQEDENSDN